MNSRRTVLLLVAALIAAFFILDLGQYLTLDFLKSQHQAFLDYYASHQMLTITIYFMLYILVTALSLPGAAIMTLAGGAIFGLLYGVLIISFASTIGATLAFLISRFLLRDYVQKRFGDKLKAVNDGIERDGDFYLFTLRLIPIFPFFIINLVMGLTPMKARRFYVVSQIGMLPGTIVYVNAGSQLGKLDSLSGILSPSLLLSFALLGLFPLLAKKFVEWLKRRKLRQHYPQPEKFDYNLVVIGGGSAGLVSALIAATVKAKVALIEKHKMGGDCLNTGCVPSKALIRSAKMLSYAHRARDFGLQKTEVSFDFAEVMERIQRVIKKIEPHDSVERFTRLGVDVKQGHAQIRSPFEVEVGGEVLTTRNIIIATGARPAVPDIPGIKAVDFLTSDTLWDLRQQPPRLLVLGGGPIGCELAQSFQRLGSKVTLVQRGERLLPREDAEISAMVMQRFVDEGMNVLIGHTAKRFEDANTLICKHAGEEVEIAFDRVLIALGRQANTEGFGLEALGVRIARGGTIEADPLLRTNIPNIYVCGDVTGPYQFTHTASHQAWYASVNALF
ncbi:MAG TPA: pyridine nucleotide-disulfide oxidoreductase, partial [Gammaproteobacteria bacterium]|nr:pyridine nucleotide-disulfide oxidoreductase [Gammaproteobacteria bacterium]